MKDVVRALVVIALLFLSFGHKPVNAAEPAYDQQLTAYFLNTGTIPILCGDGLDAGDHAPCHACRIFSGLDVPLPPAIAERAYPAFTRVSFVRLVEQGSFAPLRIDARPRAPPAA